MHPRCHSRLVLPLHRNHPIDLLANQWDVFYTIVTLLIPGTNFFIYFSLIFHLIEDILHPFPQVFTSYLSIATINFMITKKFTKLNFISLKFCERQ